MTFEKITNFDEKLDLSVSNHQRYYIETIDECLNEAKYYDGWNAFKIIIDDEIVAFVMYGQFPEENNRVYLDRFFIDTKHQRKGYFKKIMPVLLEKIAKQYQVCEIYSSVYKDNEIAYNLFINQGFVLTGEKDLNGESVMCVKI